MISMQLKIALILDLGEIQIWEICWADAGGETATAKQQLLQKIPMKNKPVILEIH